MTECSGCGLSIEGGGTVAPQGAGVVQEFFEQPQRVADIVAQVVRKTGEDERLVKGWSWRNVDGTAV